MSKNDITGDDIKSRISNEKFESNFESIFGDGFGYVTNSDGEQLKKCSRRCWLEIKDNKPSCDKPGCESEYTK